jgi:2-polyprenyl-6-methoxyphenol hydroxylase-like FAD-dependent oxidoreductase
MIPSMGSGAGSAIEDAYLLGYIIARAISGSSKGEVFKRLSTALRVYDHIRRPLDCTVHESSRKMGRISTLVDLSEDEPADSIKRQMDECWSWCSYFLSPQIF